MTDINNGPFHHQPNIKHVKPPSDQGAGGADALAKGENAKADVQDERHLLNPDAIFNHLNTMGPATVLSARTAEVLGNLDPTAVNDFETNLLQGEFSFLNQVSELDRAMVVSDLFLDSVGATPVIANA